MLRFCLIWVGTAGRLLGLQVFTGNWTVSPAEEWEYCAGEGRLDGAFCVMKARLVILYRTLPLIKVFDARISWFVIHECTI